MMLDTKSEQKWPLADGIERYTVKGHFFLFLEKATPKGVALLIYSDFL